jgi:hypothetical protein
MSGRTLRYILVGALALAIGIPSVAIGFGEGRSLLLGKRNPSPHGSRALSTETEIIASNGTYGTRQSNKKDGDGGGAIYGCRSNPGAEPCVRANNLKGGRAFEFETVGKEGGHIEVGDTTGAPFTTNATGTATGLSADKVDGKDSTDFAATGDILMAVVAANGTLEHGRGATAAALTNAPSERFRVTFNRDVSACAYTVSPQGDAAEQAFGVRSPADNKNQVVVDQPDPGGARAFHLQVVC